MRFLIVDYNLSRVADVQRIRRYARERHGALTTLIRAHPTDTDTRISDEVVQLDPLDPDFAAKGEKLLSPRREEFAAGVVFSDDAVHSGADLLTRLGLRVDAPQPAAAAFCKITYRDTEHRHRDLLSAQRLTPVDFVEVESPADIAAFARRHPEGFVVKPAKEGNNRGVVLVRPGDDLDAAWAEVRPYLADGVLCEELIPYRREFSYDGLGELSFVTEKVSAPGRYPVEVAQVLPARVTPAGRATLRRAGGLANWLVGQCDGPFHNEIKLSDDDTAAAVVEPNRRPAGMRIWSLARWVHGVDLYEKWVDAAFGRPVETALPEPDCAAATVMLGVATDRAFAPADVRPDADPFEDALAATRSRHGLAPDELTAPEFGWVAPDRRELHATARDNADFAAQCCVVLRSAHTDVREVVHTLREVWPAALDTACAAHRPAAPALLETCP
ncbi:biotin carboxylase [Streptomyces sp. SID13726]|uniref:ATP-grasp domain-containing protein n=1 Tax=Streptomyces sp. SID13726 TaxID=2706058 RepID=UPI0013BC8276|nr:biotin carboxylase [Streptomyces sp. SID13726]NEB00235.1 biotin carboxylase [Streptomyces sp. SID13726]